MPTVVGLVAVGIALVALALFWRSNQAGRAAEYQSRIAQSRALAAYAEDTMDQGLAVLLGLEAVYQTHRHTPDTMTAEASSALYHAIECSRWQATLRHKAWVYHAAWSSDGAHIVTASEDGSAKMWDAQTGEKLFTLSEDTWGVNHAAWSSDGTRIVIASDDGSARIYFARIDDLIEFACTRTGRNMTREEWQRYMGDTAPHRLTCPNLPARGW